MPNRRIGVTDGTNAKLKGGPRVFMARLRKELADRGLSDQRDPDGWINLSFTPLPKNARSEGMGKFVRWDGIYNTLVLSSRWRLLPGFLRRFINRLGFRFFNRRLLANYAEADGIIFQSEYSKRLVEKALIGGRIEKPHVIIMNGVDLERFRPKARDRSSGPVILVSHRMTPLKRHYLIPSVVAETLERLPGTEVHVLGSGFPNPFDFLRNSMGVMDAEIDRLGIRDKFHFRGHVDPEELAGFYGDCDLMLNLSFADPCPNVVIEALACGLPVIAPDSGGIAEIVGRSDWLVEEDIDPFALYPWDYRDVPGVDPSAYAARIESVWRNIGENAAAARRRAENEFDIRSVVDRYIAFCENGIHERN